MKGADWKQFINLARRADLVKPDGFIKQIIWKFRKYPEQKLYKKYIRKVIISWDLTDGDRPFSVDEGLKTLPAYFITRLYYSLMTEIKEQTMQTLSADLKKKLPDG